MKQLFCALVLVTALAGCGNWSNADVEFLYALPSREQLKVDLPSTGVAQQGLELGTRRDGLALNAPSTVHGWTRKAADDVNGMVFNLLEVLEKAKSLNPSRREEGYREWGPFRHGADREREVRLVIRRNDGGETRYDWSIEVRRLRDGEWVQAIVGSYLPTDDLRRGAGYFSLEAERVRRAGFAGADDDPNLQKLEIRYVTDSEPLHIELDLVALNGTLAYVYDEYADGSGAMQFDVTANWLAAHDGGTAALETLKVKTQWIPSGAGRADVLVTGGDVGAKEVDGGEECWDAAFNVVYGRENWDSDGDGVRETIGNPAACALP